MKTEEGEKEWGRGGKKEEEGGEGKQRYLNHFILKEFSHFIEISIVM